MAQTQSLLVFKLYSIRVTAGGYYILGIGFYCYYLSGATRAPSLFFNHRCKNVFFFLTKLSVNYSTNCPARHCRCQ